MKYIITENKLDKVVFKYLDNTLKGLEKRDANHYEGFVFAYPNKNFGILGYMNDGTLRVNSKFIEEISSNFGLEYDDTRDIVGRWVNDRLQLDVIETLSYLPLSIY